ncbi:hypothetical protein DM02DRAFT_607998 [Periconia macrospinosa]|uniref:EDC4-like protein pdc1 beta-propeller domain-containing protein n=1 Tax=Periconia macrospinosa TaxID=97972 RepID=A0A2V1EE18_9PLEO|nr:hypothetical protein DM02DRAFT_607998 [Periconia macrospinosa]
MADLQELFARLSNQNSAAGNQQAQPHGYQQPSVSSPIFSPSPSGLQPHHHSAVMSPNTSAANTPTPEHGSSQQSTQQQQSAHLLNLLRFNSQPNVAQAARRSSQNTQSVEGTPSRAVSATDLVAGFMGGKSSHAPTSGPAPPAARPEPASVSAQNPQDLLMRLLNHPKPAQGESQPSRASAAAFSPPPQMPETVAVEEISQELAEAKLEDQPSSFSPMHVFGSDGPGGSQFEPDTTARSSPAGPPKFTYVNPFEKLEAASPRIRTPAPEPPKQSLPPMQILKPKHGMDRPAAVEANEQPLLKSRKLSPSASAHSHPHETVAEAVSDLGEEVGKQVEEALEEIQSRTEAKGTTAHTEMEQAVVATAAEIEKELADEKIVQALEETMPKPLVAALKGVAAEVAQGDVVDSWESADDSPAKTEDRVVIVYRFPMRAFASITVQDSKDSSLQRASFSTELFMDVARLKKEFDQIDRSLVSASKNFIVYAQVKKGGFRIIRQESGQFRQVFEDQKERLFNVGLCVAGDDSSQRSLQSVLGIGVNGSVFWTSIETDRDDKFGPDIDTQGLILPPSPAQDDNTSGGQLKTRAKPSSRHPEFFAVGRGKAIHIIWPHVAAEYVRPKSRVVQTEKFLKERSLKILTGKAGKDFTFSEDDTVVVSLDKAGRMRFWDIRPLIDPEVADLNSEPKQVEVSQTMLEFHTTSANAKSWPTSVFFFDKDKPFNKGIALRYVIVGMKQNHSFQLWDLGLGKAVQEINLPHEKESDAICSVAFHPKTGVMAVAHPTRNSIFFIHVSCPRYNLPVMSQATYISRLADKTQRSQLPAVNATAIMTSITEYSFAPKGQIRSLHMLNEPAGPPDVEEPDNISLFELYVMHSKGVCALRIRRSDLGWKKEGEPINPKDAEKEGVISIAQLKPPQPVDDASVSTTGDTQAHKSVSDKSARESIKRENSNMSRASMTPEAAARANSLAKVESKQDAARAAIINGGEKSEKKKKKRSNATETASQASTSTSTRAPPPSYAQAAQSVSRSKSPVQPDSSVLAEPRSTPVSDNEMPEWAKKFADRLPDVKKIEEIIQTELTKSLSRELDGLHKRIDEDKRVMNAQFSSKQDAILRLVSSTLTDNVEGVIKKMVTENMRDVLLPALLSQTATTLEKNIGGSLKSALGPQLSKDIPEHISRTLKAPHVIQSLSDQVSKKVTSTVDPLITAAVGSAINPAIATITSLVENKIGEQLREAHAQRHNDTIKIAQLTETVHTCLQTIQGMATTQAELQSQIAKLHEHVSQSSQQYSSPHASPNVTRSPPKQKSPEELEEDEIRRYLSEGKFEQGTMLWLQSPRSDSLFDTVFVLCNPQYLDHVSPLLALSTGAVVTNVLDRNLAERLLWLAAVLKNVNPHDPEIRDVVPKIMDVIRDRLTQAYMSLNENSPGDVSLRRISTLVARVNEISRAVPYGGRV